MTPTIRKLLVLLALSVPAVPLDAQDGGSEDPGSTEGAIFLLLPVGAKAVSLGRAMTVMDGPESIFWNPAGLAGVHENQIVLFRSDHLSGTATAVAALLANGSVGTLSAGYFLQDLGESAQTDEFGNPTGALTIRNHVGLVSAATRLFDHVNAGVTFKVVRFRFKCEGICLDEGTTSTTYAVDAGVQALPTDRLRIGAMIAHLGPSFQVKNAEQADPLPTRVRVAVAYDVVRSFTDNDELSGWFAMELQDRVRDVGSPSLYLGSELIAGRSDALFLRAGYVVGDLDQENGARVGLGMRYERFDLAIAKSLAVSTLTGETEPVHVTFAIRF